MPKIPRDISARDFVKLLRKYDYAVQRQSGSHIRLCSSIKGYEHKITIPDHNPIKIGTLNNILREISDYLQISKDELVSKLF